MPRLLPRARRLAGPAVVAVLLVALGVVVTGTREPAEASAGRASGVSTGGAAAGLGRAMWVWNQPAPKTLVSFAKSRGVSDLFVSVPPALPSTSRLSWVGAVRDLAAPAGIRLQALGGDPGWVDDPAAAVAWEEAAVSTGLFSGVHVDVEPWQHPRWGSDQAAVVRGYLDTLQRLEDATTLPVDADVSFWLWTVHDDTGRPLDAAVLDRVDAVTVMSYRTTVTGTDSITDIGSHTLDTASAAGKLAHLSVETNDLGSDATARKQTFYGQRESALNAALSQVDTIASASPSYAGVAVHDYAGYDALR
ncbi:MAG: hypothetical protein HOQ22_03130 [Nocardioidaceae bacterium]|nr:hypothetical protein [Nocardioidaceae bacterium]NUS50019.1 hypothetical protein [Nocardioidaceae bacterium]